MASSSSPRAASSSPVGQPVGSRLVAASSGARAAALGHGPPVPAAAARPVAAAARRHSSAQEALAGSYVPPSFTRRVAESVAAAPLTVAEIAALPAERATGASVTIPPPPVIRRPSVMSSLDDLDAPVPLERAIYCNRSLNMRDVRAVGFDSESWQMRGRRGASSRHR